jgi:L-asparaginase
MSKTSILLIYTGGTIGMVRDFKTGALKAFNFDKLLKNIPELQLLECTISTVSFKEPIDSSNMNPDYWVTICNLIAKDYDKYHGFVVLHGSDTMSYTASALSFMLENLCKPVIFTGSQLPIGDLRTDAKENLITAIQLASLRENKAPLLQEVGLYFEYKLYRANRTTKISADHFEAFDSPNYPPLVTSGVELMINREALLKSNKDGLVVRYELVRDILLLKMHPGISEKMVRAMLSIPGVRGVILETYGAGNTTTKQWFVAAIKEAIEAGIPVVNVTQCIAGKVQMGNYETSIQLKEIGVISGKDITTEAALVKMMYLLGQEIDSGSFKAYFEKPLRGELS